MLNLAKADAPRFCQELCKYIKKICHNIIQGNVLLIKGHFFAINITIGDNKRDSTAKKTFINFLISNNVNKCDSG